CSTADDNSAMGINLAAFVVVSVLLILAPGPDMALVTRNTLLGARRSGLFTALGVVTGLTIWSLAAALGLAALLRASEPAFVTVKLVGAAYLVFLGARTLYGAITSRQSKSPEGDQVPRQRLGSVSAFRQGVISNLGNPKIAVFFTSFLPQFVGHGGPNFLSLFLLGLLFCVLTLLWLTSYAHIVARAGDFLRRPRVRRALEGMTGVVLLAFGLRLATEHR
ncbi:MAG TPA: LysE family translocator, partial [Chloroflexota bacterium]